MSEKKQTKNKKVNIAKLQIIALWVLIAGSLLFWGGVAVGTQATLNSQAREQALKAQAVEEYKLTSKEVQ